LIKQNSATHPRFVLQRSTALADPNRFPEDQARKVALRSVRSQVWRSNQLDVSETHKVVPRWHKMLGPFRTSFQKRYNCTHVDIGNTSDGGAPLLAKVDSAATKSGPQLWTKGR
jgi:hypothetical protein